MENALAHQDTKVIVCTIAAVLMPLVAAKLNMLFFNKSSRVSGWLSTAAILVSCVCAIYVFAQIWNVREIHVRTLWFSIGSTKLYAGLLLNNLSVLLLLLVSIIALPVHIYGTAYMKGDAHFGRYFAYLSFFCFSMLALVVVDNLVLVYAFWELVGFSSYLLIGFWNTRDRAVQANKKAFIMNRIGDIGLLSAVIILFTQFHTFDLDLLFNSRTGLVGQAVITNGLWISQVNEISATWQYIACGGIILAVAAKSAQFPLHTWLPDAMEGPTSVSALIHAATMVAAGVFLLGRFYPFFNGYELNALAIIGCFTAFMAATIALTQNDLKRILAYSTISQLGFMVMAMGIGAYGSSLFHLVTHAFFKCLLFLSAGIIIHEMQHLKDEHNLDIDPQNILYMGGLRKKLPLTFVVCVVAALALVGLPLTSGYLSKDGIIIQAFEWAGGKAWYFSMVPVFALLTGALTAFYVGRLMFKVFFGQFEQERVNPHIKAHFTDGGLAYKVPLVFLAVCCLFLVFSFNPIAYEHAWVVKGLGIVDQFGRENPYHSMIPIGVTILSVLIIYWAYTIYVSQKRSLFPQHTFLFKLSYNEWYIDKFYDAYIVKGVLALSSILFWFDKNIIDGFINLLAELTLSLASLTKWLDKYVVDGFLHSVAAAVVAISNFARGFQNGKVQYYLFSMLAVVLAIFIYKILI